MTLNDTARKIFADSIGKLSVHAIARLKVRAEFGAFVIEDLTYPMQSMEQIVVVSIGKAAGSMWDAIVPVLRSALNVQQTLEGFVVGPVRPTLQADTAVYFDGGHPLPNQASLDAAAAILKRLAACDERCFVLFLISGGSSAMVEQALDPDMHLADIVDFYRSLVGSGLSIGDMNVLRKHFSGVKGGRLAVAAQNALMCTLLVSDVPANSLHVVGSGPSVPDPSTITQCRSILVRHQDVLRLSQKLRDFFASETLPETPKTNRQWSGKNFRSLVSSDDLCALAAKHAMDLGFHVVVDNHCDEWDYREAAAYLIGRLRKLTATHRKVCLISVGEVSVVLPLSHGVGGRNQQFVLESARQLAELQLSATVLSGGSDGIDGNSPAAGSIGDETTFRRAIEVGHNPSSAHDTFNSFELFRSLGDTIITGPTGNNVRDLRILLTQQS